MDRRLRRPSSLNPGTHFLSAPSTPRWRVILEVVTRRGESPSRAGPRRRPYWMSVSSWRSDSASAWDAGPSWTNSTSSPSSFPMGTTTAAVPHANAPTMSPDAAPSRHSASETGRRSAWMPRSAASAGWSPGDAFQDRVGFGRQIEPSLRTSTMFMPPSSSGCRRRRGTGPAGSRARTPRPGAAGSRRSCHPSWRRRCPAGRAGVVAWTARC